MRTARPAAGPLCVAAVCAAAGFAAPPNEPPPPDRVVVLTGGRVYRGLVRPQAGGVRVISEHGSVLLPRDHVRLTAPTLPAAAEALFQEIDAADPDALADLAGWCHTNGLSETARGHLVAALTLAPARDDLRRSLARVERSLAAAAIRPAAHARPAAAPAGGGVSPALLGAFTRTVQPILVARCGNAACHGGGSRNPRPFRLTTPARSSAATRRNLAAAAEYAGDGTPAGSPLLSTCPTRPDRRGRMPFAGVGGAASYRALAAWAAAVADKRGESPKDVPGVTDSRATPPATQADPLDPAAFNRRFAPPAAGPAAPTDPEHAPRGRRSLGRPARRLPRHPAAAVTAETPTARRSRGLRPPRSAAGRRFAAGAGLAVLAAAAGCRGGGGFLAAKPASDPFAEAALASGAAGTAGLGEVGDAGGGVAVRPEPARRGRRRRAGPHRVRGVPRGRLGDGRDRVGDAGEPVRRPAPDRRHRPPGPRRVAAR